MQLSTKTKLGGSVYLIEALPSYQSDKSYFGAVTVIKIVAADDGDEPFLPALPFRGE